MVTNVNVDKPAPKKVFNEPAPQRQPQIVTTSKPAQPIIEQQQSTVVKKDDKPVEKPVDNQFEQSKVPIASVEVKRENVSPPNKSSPGKRVVFLLTIDEKSSVHCISRFLHISNHFLNPTKHHQH